MHKQYTTQLNTDNKYKVLAIVGPTASGKTQLAHHIALTLNSELINADAMMFYKYMSIGTAKPSQKDISKFSYHLIDFLHPNDCFSVNQFTSEAGNAVKEISIRGNLPILVGGSGQYIWSFLEGWKIPQVPPNPELRLDLEKEAREKGSQVLFDTLLKKAPQSAALIDKRNLRRVIRAIERAEAGITGDTQQRSASLPYDFTVLSIKTSRESLHKAVRQRVINMVNNGWIQEVTTLLNYHNVSLDSPSMKAIGYREIAQYINKQITLEQAIDATCISTHKLIRSQTNWFKATDPRIHWVDSNDTALEVVHTWLQATNYTRQPHC